MQGRLGRSWNFYMLLMYSTVVVLSITVSGVWRVISDSDPGAVPGASTTNTLLFFLRCVHDGGEIGSTSV